MGARVVTNALHARHDHGPVRDICEVTISRMVKSFYKGERLGKLPPCLVCAGPGEGPRALLYLTHGVSLCLCAGHRAPEFLRKRAGRDFVLTISQMWSAAGITS